MSELRPLVTIVIPCFNYARFLPAAIESALAQTYRPIEVIVVDDGSTDNSAEVARRYPVRLVSQRNQGLSTSTNNGVLAGSGEFFLRLDADDVLWPEFVEKTMAALLSDPGAALAYADGTQFGLRSGRFELGPLDVEALALGAYVHCCALTRRAAWQAVGGLDPTTPLCEDWDLWLTFAERGYRGVKVDVALWGYRQHGPSMVNRSFNTWSDVHREYQLIAHLQDYHAAVFSPWLLMARLFRTPRAIVKRQMSMRKANKLLAFYAVMLLRAATGLHQHRQREAHVARV